MNSLKKKQKPLIEAEYEDVPPTEDLMKEHGILNRILLIYESAISRLEHNMPFQAHVVGDAASIVRAFIEDYHEKQEEDFLFPRFRQANMLIDLVNTLLEQHDRGRVITDYIMQRARDFKQSDSEQSKAEFAQYLRCFTCMYRAHEAREDTVLFPTFRTLVSHAEFKELSEFFENNEDQHFGKGGYKTILHKVEELEKEFDIYDLAHYTPQIDGCQKSSGLCVCRKKR